MPCICTASVPFHSNHRSRVKDLPDIAIPKEPAEFQADVLIADADAVVEVPHQ